MDPNYLFEVLHAEELIAKDIADLMGISTPSTDELAKHDEPFRESKYWKCEAEIKKKASQGFKYARLIDKSMGYFKPAVKKLGNLMRLQYLLGWNNPTVKRLRAETILLFGYCLKTIEFVVTLDIESTKFLHCMALQMMKEQTGIPQLNLHSLICYSSLSTGAEMPLFSLLPLLEHIESGILKYPQENIFHTLKCDIFGFMGSFEDGIKSAEKSLKKFPNDYELLFGRAAMMKHLLRVTSLRFGACKLKPDKITDAHLQFLKYAPQDHRHRPDIFYSLAETLIITANMVSKVGAVSKSINVSLCSQIRKHYQSGLRAEKYLLPCFLPYEYSNSKTVVEFHLRVFDNAPLPTWNVIPSGLTKTQKIREWRQSVRGDIAAHFFKLNITGQKDCNDPSIDKANPESETKVTDKDKGNESSSIGEKLSQMESIELWDMDKTNDDCIYEGRFLKLTIIEDSLIDRGEYLHTIVEDTSGEVERCFIYGLDPQDASLHNRLGYGCVITVMNPKMHLASDGKHCIRIDSPKSSIVDHLNEKMKARCRFCGKEGATQRCGNCKIARYCNKDCQVRDWKVLNHKVICNKPAE